MQIKRNFYLQQLIDGKQNGLIKIITGIRRCGKSYLLFTLFKQHLIANGILEDHIIQIALDDIENSELREPLTLYRHIKAKMIDDDLYYILLDEVQLVPRFEEVLNSLLRIENADVYVTGSNSKFLSSDIITEFRGRGDEIHLYRFYIQSALALPDEEKRQQEMASLLRINDSFKKIIIVKDDIKPWRDENGILTMGLLDFLMNPDSLVM